MADDVSDKRVSRAPSTTGATASAATRAPTPVSGAVTLRRIAVFGHCPNLLHTQSFTLCASQRTDSPAPANSSVAPDFSPTRWRRHYRRKRSKRQRPWSPTDESGGYCHQCGVPPVARWPGSE